MNKYKCDICGKPATVHITKIVNGQKSVVHLCQDCAASSGAAGELVPQIQEMEKAFLENAMSEARKEVSVETAQTCPGCGSSFEEIEKSGRFHCPKCAEAFGDKALAMIRQMQGGAMRHIGKIPKKFEGKIDKGAVIAELKIELERAIKQERYEEAAQIRDKLKSLQKA